MITFQALPAGLVNELKALAKLDRSPHGYLDALGGEYGYKPLTLSKYVSLQRELLREEQDGAAGMIPPARVCGPERAGAVSGHDSQGPSPLAAGASRDLDVSSLNLGARGESRAVAPAAGVAPPAPLERVGAAPAAEFSEEEPYSPGLRWARQRLLAGIPLDKLLRTAGEQLTWRDRDQLRGVPA